jgi:hypothetical protein
MIIAVITGITLFIKKHFMKDINRDLKIQSTATVKVVLSNGSTTRLYIKEA